MSVLGLYGRNAVIEVVVRGRREAKSPDAPITLSGKHGSGKRELSPLRKRVAISCERCF